MFVRAGWSVQGSQSGAAVACICPQGPRGPDQPEFAVSSFTFGPRGRIFAGWANQVDAAEASLPDSTPESAGLPLR